MLINYRHSINLLILVAAPMAIGCNVHSENPLSNPSEAVVDDTLVGAWQLQMPSEEDGTEVYLHIGRANTPGERGTLRCLAIFHNLGEGLPPASSAQLFATELGSRRILNLKWLTDSGTGRYSFAKYETEDDQLRLYPLRKQPIIDAIKADKIEGKVNWAIVSQSVTLTDDSDSLFKYMAQADDETLFGKTTNLVFDRISR